MEMWQCEGVSHSEESIENYHLNLQLPSATEVFSEFQLIF